MNRTDLSSRLASLPQLEVLSERTRSRHLATLSQALTQQPANSLRRVPFRWRRPVVAWLAAALAVTPVAAVASQDALPGDNLYPVKRVFERVLTIFDEQAPARHRIDEVEGLLQRHASEERLAKALDAAEDEVARVSDDDLWAEWEKVRDEAERNRDDSREGRGSGSSGSDDDTADSDGPTEGGSTPENTVPDSDDTTSDSSLPGSDDSSGSGSDDSSGSGSSGSGSGGSSEPEDPDDNSGPGS